MITGASRGLGLHIARRFLQDGDELVLVARSFDTPDHAPEPSVVRIPFDLTDLEGIPALAEQIGGIDILINNAGMASGLPDDAYTVQDMEYILRLNLAAPIALMTQYLPQFVQRGGGRVVNITSQAGVFGHYDTWYGATKAGLINATRSFAGKYGRHGLIFHSVAPGPVEGEKILSSPHLDRYERVKQRTILKRYAQPEEVADLVHWLAKESPVYLNGENYLLNNGVTSFETY